MGVVTRKLSASLATLRLERERELYNTIFQGTSDPWLLCVIIEMARSCCLCLTR